MRGRTDRTRRLLLALLATMLSAALWTTAAQASTLKVVRYHGYAVRVPRSWPVYDLARAPQTCVRFNRHAVYLGTPSTSQVCPSAAVGRTEAILVTPGARAPRGAVSLGPRSTRFTSAGVTVTATWNREAAVISRALGRRSLPAPPAATPARKLGPRAARTAQASSVYTGRGFDVCSTPSTHAMSAWGSSPYRGIGIYIGGANMACSQPNQSSAWVSTEVASGWHLILIYVGLQAPSNSCGCASISTSSSQAAAQGTAAANDAVAEAQAIGIPQGSPIYDDMEYYSRTSTNTSAVMSYLGAWTTQLHSLGYVSGVYGNSNSVMTDFVNREGTSFAEPDDIWFAEWNGQQSTSTSYIPASDWANHQRIHQYGGSRNETWGGVTLNIDPDYIDAATAGSSDAGASIPSTPPSLSVSPSGNGPITLGASWGGAIGVTGWTFLAEDGSGAMTPIATEHISGGITKLTTHAASPYYEVQALGSGNQVLGISPAVAMPRKLMVYGKTAFVPAARGALGGVPVGCYTAARCSVTTTITVGRAVIAKTGTEPIGSDATSLMYFRLTALGRALLTRAHKLPVKISVHDVTSGVTTTDALTLVAFSTSGRAATRQLSRTGDVRVVGLTDFVSNGWVGGILAGCTGVPVCQTATTLSVGSTVIARTGTEAVGENELSYLLFTLTSQGHAMLTRAKGNRLTVRATLTGPSGSASANIALVRY